MRVVLGQRLRVVFAAVFVVGAAVIDAHGQPTNITSQVGRGVRRTPDGYPDLQGLWLNNTATPLERPKGLEDRPFFTAAEARTYEQTYIIERVRAGSMSGRGGTAGSADIELAMAASDIATAEPGRVLPELRTSLVIDPPNGKVPLLTPEAQRRLAQRAERLQKHYADNPENLPNSERCLVVANTAVPPLLPNIYNNTLQIVQTRDAVVLVSETIHDARIISLNRQTHLPESIRLWKGDSIGRWEGDTLVVDTTNFSEQTSFRGSGPRLHVTERLTIRPDGMLGYDFSISDPETFLKPWSAASAFTLTADAMFEFACHEGNYSMANILRAARFGDTREQR